MLMEFGGPKKFMGKEYDGIHRTTFVIDEHGIIFRYYYESKNQSTYFSNLGI